jgi:hypothetical protein
LGSKRRGQTTHRKACRRDLRVWDAGGPNPVGHSRRRRHRLRLGDRQAEQAEDDLRFEKIGRKAYDKLGNLRQKGEDEYKRCFTQNAPKLASFAEATRQAERLLSTALNTR